MAKTAVIVGIVLVLVFSLSAYVILSVSGVEINWTQGTTGTDGNTNEEEAGSITLGLRGTTSVMNENGNPVVISSFSKMSFQYAGLSVSALVTEFDWDIVGENVDWDTLKIIIETSSTVGATKTYTYSSSSGSFVYELPISLDMLGYTPAEGEGILWGQNVKVNVEIMSDDKTVISLNNEPIRGVVLTTWKGEDIVIEPSDPDPIPEPDPVEPEPDPIPDPVEPDPVEPEPTYSYVCPLCGAEFSTYREYEFHAYSHDEPIPLSVFTLTVFGVVG